MTTGSSVQDSQILCTLLSKLMIVHMFPELASKKKAVSFFRKKTRAGYDYFELTMRLSSVELLATSGFFRDRNIQLAEKSNHLNSVRVLSVSHIFPVSKLSQDNCLTNYVKSEIDIALKQFAYKDLCLSNVSAKSLMHVKDVLNACNDGGDISEVTFGTEDELEECLETICKKIICPRSRIHQRSEASFLDQYLMPFINEVVLRETGDYVVYSLIDGSEKKKTKKPDFMLGVEDRKRELYFLYVEFKRPACKSIHKRKMAS